MPEPIVARAHNVARIFSDDFRLVLPYFQRGYAWQESHVARLLADMLEQAEGNPLLVVWMGMLGYGPALLGAKALACGCGVILYVFGVNRALASLTAFYLFGAVMPWLQVLSTARG